jgi:hypothetical protein
VDGVVVGVLVPVLDGEGSLVSLPLSVDTMRRYTEGCGGRQPSSSAVDGDGDDLRTVRVFRQTFTLEDAIGSHACSLEANMRVTNGIPLGSPLPLPLSS